MTQLKAFCRTLYENYLVGHIVFLEWKIINKESGKMLKLMQSIIKRIFYCCYQKNDLFNEFLLYFLMFHVRSIGPLVNSIFLEQMRHDWWTLESCGREMRYNASGNFRKIIFIMKITIRVQNQSYQIEHSKKINILFRYIIPNIHAY